MKTRLFLLTFLCCGALLQSCAYYNTFYNTKKYFREGLAENKKRAGEKPTSQEVQKFDLAIEKASKVLQLYPKSKYADDAILILGQSFFYKQEYLKAQRKFEELLANFPKSKLVPTSRLWLAKTDIELRDFNGAERVVRELQKQPRRGGLNEEAQALLGEVYYRQEMYSRAAQEFEVASKELDDKILRGRCLMRLGECYRRVGNLRGAVESFRMATSLGGDQEFKFQSSLQFAIALKEEKQYQEAMRIFQSLLSEFPSYKDLPLVKLQFAQCYHGQGKVGPAQELYAGIIESHPRSEAAAAAYFYLGEIYEREEGDFAKAQENYDKVRKENVRSDKVNEATQRSKSIAEFGKLKQSMAALEKQRQMLRAGETPPAVVADTATTTQGRRSSTKNAAATTTALSAENVIDELARNKIQLAELYYFQFGKLDSAIHEYVDVASYFPESAHAPQALYSLAYLLDDLKIRPAMRDSILQVLSQKYPASLQGREARRRLGFADATANGSSELADFLSAERTLFNKREPRRALQEYQEFIEKYPQSSYLPRSLYAIGWIYENHLGENRQAFDAYQRLIEKFPNSDFAKEVRAKVSAAEKQFKSAELTKSSEATAQPTAATGAAGSIATAADSLAAQKNLDAREKTEADGEKKLSEEKDRLPIRKPPAREERDQEPE